VLDPSTSESAGFSSEFSDLLSILEHPGPVTICWKASDGRFRWKSGLTTKAAHGFASDHQSDDVWFSANPILVEGRGRGTTRDVVGLPALYADLDAKPDGLVSIASCWAVVNLISQRLGVGPVAVVHSGHGLQPYWRVDGWSWEYGDQKELEEAKRVLARFRRLVEECAEAVGGQVDAVFDLARIMRVPGTANLKHPEHPVVAELVIRDPLAQSVDLDTLRNAVGTVPERLAVKQTSELATKPPSRGSSSVDQFVNDVASAKEHHRNATLNKSVFLACLNGLWDTEVEGRIHAAAVSTGLSSAAVESTIKSAVKAAGRRTEARDVWLPALVTQYAQSKRRDRFGLIATARHLADVAANVDPPVGMTCRRLSDAIQISDRSAANHLKKLWEDGWLTRSGVRRDGYRYEMVTPERHNLHSYQGDGSSLEELCKLGRKNGYFAHDSFSLWAGTRSLPKSCAVVLEALADCPDVRLPVSRLVALTSLSASTVRRCLLLLESAGFVSYVRRQGAVVLGNPHEWADAWASWSGAAGNRDRRREQHEAEREQYRRDLETAANRAMAPRAFHLGRSAGT
jgi:hypothetical protein